MGAAGPLAPERRMVIAAALTLAAFPASAAEAAGARRLHRRSVVIDGNLIADPLFDARRIGPSTAARVRASCVTAMKQTIGDTATSVARTRC